MVFKTHPYEAFLLEPFPYPSPPCFTELISKYVSFGIHKHLGKVRVAGAVFTRCPLAPEAATLRHLSLSGANKILPS